MANLFLFTFIYFISAGRRRCLLVLFVGWLFFFIFALTFLWAMALMARLIIFFALIFFLFFYCNICEHHYLFQLRLAIVCHCSQCALYGDTSIFGVRMRERVLRAGAHLFLWCVFLLLLLQLQTNRKKKLFCYSGARAVFWILCNNMRPSTLPTHTHTHSQSRAPIQYQYAYKLRQLPFFST